MRVAAITVRVWYLHTVWLSPTLGSSYQVNRESHLPRVASTWLVSQPSGPA